MKYKKFFMPIGGGDELKERINGALLVTKYFNTHLEILHSIPKTKIDRIIPIDLREELEKITINNQKQEIKDFNVLVSELSVQRDVKISKVPLKDESSVHTLIQLGDRSSMVQKESKFCDLVIAASPPNGETTATFEAAVLHSGKPVIIIPRIMTSFKIDSIIIAWNNSQEIARAITLSIDILKQAKNVHLISTEEYSDHGGDLNKLEDYLACHDIKVTKQLIKTKTYPGQALLETAQKGEFDLIISGAYSHNRGLKELIFGGTAKYLLKNSNIPVFISH
jgi:nucleotide-binding universal stress UspA family protein